jgi:hypothetical protein
MSRKLLLISIISLTLLSILYYIYTGHVFGIARWSSFFLEADGVPEFRKGQYKNMVIA